MPTVEELREMYGDKIADEFAEALQPEWYRKDIAEVGAKAKQVESLEAKLATLERQPQLASAVKELGVDYEAQPKFARSYLDAFDGDPSDKEALAAYLTEGGFEAKSEPAGQTERPAAAVIAEQATGGGTPTSAGDAKAALHADLDAIPDGDPEALREVLAKHGQLPKNIG